MSKYKVQFTATYGAPMVTGVIEADNEEEAKLKVPKYFHDMHVHSVRKIVADNEKIYIKTK